jgi:hypothetical protein
MDCQIPAFGFRYHMLRLGILLSTFLMMLPAGANTVACGGNSHSYAEIVAGRGPHRRPASLEVMPDSLCADLIEVRRREIDSIELMIDSGGSRDPETEGSDGISPGMSRPGRQPYGPER